MPISISQNLNAMYAQQQLDASQQSGSLAIKRMSSGKQFASGLEDDMGKQILGSKISRMQKSLVTVSQSIVQSDQIANSAGVTVENAMDTLLNIKALCIEGSSDTVPETSRVALQELVNAGRTSIDAMVSSLKFGDKILLDGSFAGTQLLDTKNTEGKKSYDITSVDQYTANNKIISDDSILKVGSGIEVTDSIGKDFASAEVVFENSAGTANNTTNFVADDEISIDGQSFIFVTSYSTEPRTDGKVEVRLGGAGISSMRNFVDKANETLANVQVRRTTAAAAFNESFNVTANKAGIAGNDIEVKFLLGGGGANDYRSVDVNSEGVRLSDGNNWIKNTLDNGADERTGDRTTVEIEIDTSGDTHILEASTVISIAGKKYEFTTGTATSGNIKVDHAGGTAASDIREAMKELVSTINDQNDLTYKAFYDENTDRLKIISKTSGVETNDKTIDFSEGIIGRVSGIGATTTELAANILTNHSITSFLGLNFGTAYSAVTSKTLADTIDDLVAAYNGTAAGEFTLVRDDTDILVTGRKDGTNLTADDLAGIQLSAADVAVFNNNTNISLTHVAAAVATKVYGISVNDGTDGNFAFKNDAVKISDVVKSDNSNKVGDSKLGSEDSLGVFSQEMLGELSDCSATLVKGDNTDEDNFDNNKIKISMRVGGALYQSQEIVLSQLEHSDVEGTRGKGRKINGGTKIEFSRVGGLKGEAGFNLLVRDEGYLFGDHTSSGDMQKECSQLASSMADSISKAALSLGTTAKLTISEDFGLTGMESYTVAGHVASGNHISNVSMMASSGKVQSTATMRFNAASYDNTAVRATDYIEINGTKLYALIDFDISTDEGATLQNIAKAVNTTSDHNLAKVSAKVVQDGGNDLLVLTAKEYGTGGNDMKFVASFAAGGAGDNLVHLNYATVGDKTPDAVSFGENALDSTKYLKRGANNVEATDFPPELLGKIKLTGSELIEGSADEDDNHCTANAVKFNAEVNGIRYVSENVELSGANRSNTVADGNGYNGYGNMIAGGTKILFKQVSASATSDSLTPCFSITIDSEGITAPGRNDNQTTKNDVEMFFEKVYQTINKGLDKGGIEIYQARSIVGLNTKLCEGTVLDGIRSDAATFKSSEYSESGVIGAISQFSYDIAKQELSVMVNGEKHIQKMADLGKAFDSANQLILSGASTKLSLVSEAGHKFEISLAGVHQDVRVDSNANAEKLCKALGLLFGTSGADGVNVQVSATGNDKISFKLVDLRSEIILPESINLLTAADARESIVLLESTIDQLELQRAVLRATQSQLALCQENLSSLGHSLLEVSACFLDADFSNEMVKKSQADMKVKIATMCISHSVSSVKEQIDGLSRAMM